MRLQHDPGAGNRFLVDHPYSVVIYETQGDSFRYLPDPTTLGQEMAFWADKTTIGDNKVTIASAGTIEGTGLTQAVFHFDPVTGIGANGRAYTELCLILKAVRKKGLGWHIITADGVTF